jgi:hypothetical protein
LDGAGCATGRGWTWQVWLLKEQLAHLWDYTYEGAASRFLTAWMRALRWQRLPAFDTVAQLLSRHLEGILAYCHVKVPFGKVEAINGNIRAMLRRGGAIAITSTCSSKFSGRPLNAALGGEPHEHGPRYRFRCRAQNRGKFPATSLRSAAAGYRER